MSFRLRRAFPILLLAATLLVAQWLLVQHESQIAAHAVHADCEWCLTHVPLTGALPVAITLMAAAPMPARAVSAETIGDRSVFQPLYASRAPPLSPVV